MKAHRLHRRLRPDRLPLTDREIAADLFHGRGGVPRVPFDGMPAAQSPAPDLAPLSRDQNIPR